MHPSFCASANDVPPAKLSGVTVATPAPLLVNILYSPTVVPSFNPTAKAEPLLHIIYVIVVIYVSAILNTILYM